MLFPPLKRKQHWVYDDPSGVPEGPLTVSLPEPLRAPVDVAAASEGLSPSDWRATVIRRDLRPTMLRAI